MIITINLKSILAAIIAIKPISHTLTKPKLELICIKPRFRSKKDLKFYIIYLTCTAWVVKSGNSIL